MVKPAARAFGSVKVDPRVTKKQDDMKRVYLVTFPHPRTSEDPPRRIRQKTASPAARDLASPSRFDRAAIEEVFVGASQRLVYELPQHQRRNGTVELEQMAIFMEYHQPRPNDAADAPRLPHFHIAIQAKRSFRFMPFKRALRVHYKMATHWSCAHPGYFSALRYCAFPSPTKPQAELDPEPRLWAASGRHKPLFESCQEPFTAAATQKRREDKFKAALEAGKSEPRVTEMDLYSAIVLGGFRNTPDDCHAWRRLVAQLKVASPSLYSYAFKIRTKLTSLIDDVWSWETVGDGLPMLSMTRVARLQHAATQPCRCGGQWASKAEAVFRNNSLDPSELFTDIMHALAEGRGPSAKVLVLAGRYGGEGKSFLLAPLRSIFGADGVQESPSPGSFPLMGLENKRVVLLDEWRFNSQVLRMATQLLWFEGKPIPLARPQNQAGVVGHTLYQGSAPIFITTKARDLERFQQAADWARRNDQSSEFTMLLRRLKVYTLQVPTPTLSDAVIPDCGVCFARMALQCSRHAPAGSVNSDGIDVADL